MEEATIWMSRIAMNMPMTIEKNPMFSSRDSRVPGLGMPGAPACAPGAAVAAGPFMGATLWSLWSRP